MIAFPDDVESSHYLPLSGLKIVTLAPQEFRRDVACAIQEIGSENKIENA